MQAYCKSKSTTQAKTNNITLNFSASFVLLILNGGTREKLDKYVATIVC